MRHNPTKIRIHNSMRPAFQQHSPPPDRKECGAMYDRFVVRRGSSPYAPQRGVECRSVAALRGECVYVCSRIYGGVTTRAHVRVRAGAQDNDDMVMYLMCVCLYVAHMRVFI